MTQAETEDQHGGASTAPPDTKPGGKKSAPTHGVSGQKSSTTGTAQAALREDRRKADEAQAALEDIQRRLAAVEAALAEERRKAEEAQQALAQQRQAVETRAETQEQTAEQIPGGEAAFGLMPLVGFRGADLFQAGQQLAEQALRQPPLLLKPYTNFTLHMAPLISVHSTLQPHP